MGLWNWIKSSDPLPPPVYSELGEEIHKLLEEKEEEWLIRGPDWGWSEGLHHTSGIFISWELPKQSPSDKESIHVRLQTENGSRYYNYLLTPDDLKRIDWRATALRKELDKRRGYGELKAALERLKPNPFSAAARELARCVLRGDDSAAHPLIDKCLEELNGH